ncbi:fatty acid synthase [Anoplophora glabripennis]|uniref:fatty acid synthase n=1 Tax=Anoplophora glabripennis TaxID=217634 RepID=UPI000C77AFD8|nr:fatty acid synthase [Anoplophora glabripennis]
MFEKRKCGTGGGNEQTMDYNLKGGRMISDPLQGEEIVISGLSGAFPNSMNVNEFKENLFNKVNMVTPNRRWDYDHPEMPTRSGTIPEIDKYDSGYFGVHERQSHSLDTMTSLLQERTIEAIFDAGMHPSDLEGTNTGVFVGSCFSENDKVWYWDNMASQTYAVTGSERSMMAHRLSYFLKLKGPSYRLDSACSSSLYALEHAYRAIRLGEVDAAIVAGTQLCLHPFVTMQFSRLGVLSHDGVCKCFDARGDGYARSEAVISVVLQKSKSAKRAYGQLVHIGTNSDGYKEQGITFPSAPAQIDLLTEFYNQCDVDKCSLSYLETHGTSTVVGDPEECYAIDTVFTKHRKQPLLIGSVKSNIGHSEAASGLCSITKCIIAMESGFIPPNLNFTTPRKEIKGIVEGRMKVVVDKMPFEDDRSLIGVSSFGFGGSNCHVLLKRNPKEKINKGLPEDNLPRLVCVSGRTTEAVNALLDAVSRNGLDAEFVGLLHEGYRRNVEDHLYRGYAIVTKTGEISRSLKCSPGSCKPLYIVFGELDNWRNIGHQLMVLPTFSAFIQRLQNNLSTKGVHIWDLLLNRRVAEKNSSQVLGSIVVQAGIIEVLNLLCIKPKAYLSYSFGGLLSSYCNDLLSLEETVNCALVIDEAVNNNNNNNSNEKTNILQTYTDLDSNGNANRDNLHSAFDSLNLYLDSSTTKKDLINKLSNTLADKKVFKDQGTTEWATNCVNSLSQDRFRGTEKMDLDSVTFRIGSGPSDTSEDRPIVSLFDKKKGNCLIELMETLGRLYELGCNPQISRLYPPIQFPVSRGTEMISPYIKWLHRREKFVPRFDVELIRQAELGWKRYHIKSVDHEWAYITGHVIDGRNLFPAMGYLYLVWDAFANISKISFHDMRIVFENCRFMRATTVSQKRQLVLEVVIYRGTGNFEIVEGNTVVVKGRISLLDDKGCCSTIRAFDEPLLSHNTDFPLKTKDVYKELRLRGYNYEGAFRGIEETNVDASKAFLRWEDNWVSFLDNMLQLKILQIDSRLLYVPIFISNLTISAKDHLDTIKRDVTADNETPLLPVYCDQATGIIRSGGITISGLLAKSIPRRKDLGIPVLEKYTFVPNDTELGLHESVRVNIQIVLENTLMYQVKAMELINELTPKDAPPLMPIVEMVLRDQPLVQPFLKILSKTPLDVSVEVENRKLSGETDCLIVIASNILKRQSILDEAFMALKENGFIISREHLDCDDSLIKCPEITVLTVHKTPTETLLLLQKKANVKEPSYIKIASSDSFSWIHKLQGTLKTKGDVVLYAEKEPSNGILGLLNCLRREPDSRHVRGVFLMDDITKFQPTHSLFVDQLKKNMAVNVYKNNKWGTYRHLLLDKQNLVESEHCFVNLTVPGDLSSLRWFEGPLCHQTSVSSENKLIYVYYAALNFRDVMTASGKLTVDAITQNRLEQECVQGFEFSGRDSKGRRVMGMMTFGALSTLVLGDFSLYSEVPDSWSLEEAATVPVVYGTVVYALPIRGQLKRGETILIHSGTGAVGQAAIRFSLYFGCKVFTTVGTPEKREFLKRVFPVLEDRHIGNSRDETFEQMIYRETNGRGVDIVLNSLAEDKLVASVRCLAKGGRLIEIGKYDMANNNELSLLLFQKEASFQGVMLDQLSRDIPWRKMQLMSIFTKFLKSGAMQPLSRTVFNYDDVEEAFRFMTTGKHMGKVLIKIREPEQQLVTPPSVQKFFGLPKFLAEPDKTYVIIGGLGGFGLELADWLVVRGARKLVLSSRKGINSGYQNMRIRLWRSYGALVKISTTPITTKDGCYQLIRESLELGPIDAIFNLAVVLEDSLFENQSPEAFVTSFAPKATATEYLDELTREMCPELSHFVVFSSVSCGRGNAGQTNYGMANSVMERVCERRRQSGYPALAIEWGAVGEVGLVAEMLGDAKIEIGGTLQQKISRCLQVMDTLLKQKDATIVSSIVVAEKRGANASDNIVDAVLNILGVSDIKSVSLHSTLAELGMDSMSGVEIKQTLEREFEVYLTPKDIRTMTLARLKEIQEEKNEINQNGEATEGKTEMETVFRLVGDEAESTVPYLRLRSKIKEETVAPKVLFFPGIEGFARVFDNLAGKISAHAIGLQLTYGNQAMSIVEIAESLIPTVEEHLSKTEPFHFLAYSYGSLVALEVVHILESRGYQGTIVCLDGAPTVMEKMLEHFDVTSEEYFQTTLSCHLLSTYISPNLVLEHKDAILKCGSWDERVTLGMDLAKDGLPYERNYFRTVSNNLYWRLKALMVYSPSFSKLESDIRLYKPKQATAQDLEEDYGLSKIFTKPVDVKVFDGNHFTFLEDEALAEAINEDIKGTTSC